MIESPPTSSLQSAHWRGELSARTTIIVFVFSLTLLLVNPNGLVLTRHEILAAEPAREMLAGGSWVVPDFAGVKRVNKPPTMSWLIAASMWVFNSKAEWAARLPANLSGAALCVIVAAIAARLLGDFGGLIAGLSTATSYYILVQARLAEADVPMAACIALAYYAAIRSTNETRTRWSILFYAATGLSFLTKGVGPVFILPACIFWTILHRNRGAVRLLLNPIGIATGLVLVAAWPLAAWRAYPPIVDAWYRETFQRVSGELGEQIGRSDPWYEYLFVIPMMLLPWFPFALIAAYLGWRRGWHRRPTVSLLLCWFVAGFVILTLSAWKNRHYTIPILPACAPAAAAGILLWARYSMTRPPRHTRILIAAICVPLAIAAVVVPLTPAPFARTASSLGIILAIGVAGVLDWLARNRPGPAILWMFLSTWLLIAITFWRIIPSTDLHKPFADFARRIDPKVPSGKTVYLVGLGENQTVYYLNHRTLRIDRLEEAPSRLKEAQGPVYVLAPAAVQARLDTIGQAIKRDELILPRRQAPEDRLALFELRTR